MIGPSRPRWVLATALLVAFESSPSSSFQLVPRVVPPVNARGQQVHSSTPLDQPYCLTLRRDFRRWSSTEDEDVKEPDDDTSPTSSESYGGLYEFLTRRTGEQAGEKERHRKRDRIREWMGSGSGSSSGSSGGGTNMVRPIRVEDGSVVEDDPPRTQARFDKLFAGMPTLDEILSRDGPQTTDSPTTSSDSEQRTRIVRDDSWFEEEKRELEAEYEQIIKDMKEQIQQQRQQHPDAMPDNAEDLAESVVRQELDRVLASVKTTRAKERLQDYEIAKISELNARELTGVTDDVVEQMLKQAADEWKRKEAVQAQVDDFARYESEAQTGFSDLSVPEPGYDLDAWALERLEDMLETTQNKASEEGAAVTDILEQQIDDLRERIESEAKKGSIKPQTMKEWQMYRAIANRLGRQRGFDPLLDASLNMAEIDEEQVTKQLDSWREYIGKEEEIRKRSGLSMGTKMPFDWQRAAKHPDEDKIPIAATRATSETRTRREIRRDVNMQALEAFEALIEKSDPARAESLTKQLDALRAELEPLDYVDVEEEQQGGQELGPVDLSDFFGARDKSDDDAMLPSSLYGEEQEAIDQVLASDAETVYNSDTQASIPQAPPSTPFFSAPFDEEDKPPPPKTAFFDDDDSSYEKSPEEAYIENTKLGSADDQKLLNMYRKAGARTKEEQDAIREQWEAFQAFEKSKRDASDLSDEDISSLMEKTDLKYDISEVMKSDGDINAEKILSSIGPRPTRKKKVSDQTVPGANEELADENPKSELDPSQVSDSLFRSVSAVGGGRFKEDPQAKDEEKAKFEDYLQKEEEMRQSLDSLDDDAKKLALESNVVIDDASYAQDALASMGPRPAFKKAKKQTIIEKELSDRGNIASDDDEEAEEDEDDLYASLGPVPAWLQKERETMKKKDGYDDSGPGFAGRNIDEVFDDDQYDHNLRQLHEYEQRRAGQQKQMGIDISDIVGNKARSSDDYADYSYDTEYMRGRQQDAWGSTSFEARKSNLLGYVELSIPELNNLMDHRDSIYATGVSQYLPRINKPFKEFGAIFRLEGVLVDLTGLHQQTWTKVATEFDFRDPPIEEVTRAAVVRPDVAIREVFYWTNDVFVVRKATAAFRRIFREVFDEWASNNGIIEQPSTGELEKGSMALGADLVSQTQSASSSPVSVAPKVESEQSRLKHFQEAWMLTATELELALPTNEQIAQSTFLAPEIAVRELFRWTSDPMDIDAVVSVFTAILNGEVDARRMEFADEDSSQEVWNENTLLEAQFEAWKKVAERGSFDAPTPEEVLAAAVLNDPEVVIMNYFGWTDNAGEAHGLAEIYREYLGGLFNGQTQVHATVPAASTVVQDEPSNAVVGPTAEEILETQIQAWSETSDRHCFTTPAPDQIQLTMNSSPSDSVRRLLGWTYNFNEEQISEISETYSEFLKKSSEKYVKAYNLEVPTVSTPKVEKIQEKVPSGDELYQAMFDAWTNVAWKSGFSLPEQDQVQFAMSVGPEEAIVVGFQWTDSYESATAIADQYREQIQLKREKWIKEGYNLSASSSGSDQDETGQAVVSVRAGVSDWVKSLLDVEMSCGVTSHLDEDQVNRLLQYAGLVELFPSDKRVSNSNGYERDSQQMLGGALRIERRPDHCVVFDSSPVANGAAHEAEMRSVSLVGPYPRYELLAADTSAASFDDLTAINIRRLFGERVYDQPMLDMVQSQPQVTRKTKTAFWDDE
jgi:beta-phosphoglucomutase-like phosphatase (HAD superfamily)